MKIIKFAIFLLIATTSLYATETFQVNLEKSKVRWEGKKPIGGHHGYIKIKSGKLLFNGQYLAGGSFVIDMNTIVDEDLTDKASNAKLVNHLKSDDFFNVEKYPESKLRITSVKPLLTRDKDDHNFQVTADLTIRDKTHSISFPALIKRKGDMAEAYTFIRIDRSKWDVRYNSGNFFKDLGDKVISDDIDFNVTIYSNK